MDGAGAVMEAAEPAAAGCPRQAETSGMMELDSSPTAPIDAEAQLGPNLGHTSSGPPAVADRAQEEAHGRHDVDGGHPPSRRVTARAPAEAVTSCRVCLLSFSRCRCRTGPRARPAGRDSDGRTEFNHL